MENHHHAHTRHGAPWEILRSTRSDSPRRRNHVVRQPIATIRRHTANKSDPNESTPSHPIRHRCTPNDHGQKPAPVIGVAHPPFLTEQPNQPPPWSPASWPATPASYNHPCPTPEHATTFTPGATLSEMATNLTRYENGKRQLITHHRYLLSDLF